MMFVVPFSILILVNSTVGLTIRRSNRMHVSQSADAVSKKAESKERQTTIMLIAIVVLFLCCNTLAFVVNILENFNFEDQLYVSLVSFNNLLVSTTLTHPPEIQILNLSGYCQCFMQYFYLYAFLGQVSRPPTLLLLLPLFGSTSSFIQQYLR